MCRFVNFFFTFPFTYLLRNNLWKGCEYCWIIIIGVSLCLFYTSKTRGGNEFSFFAIGNWHKEARRIRICDLLRNLTACDMISVNIIDLWSDNSALLQSDADWICKLEIKYNINECNISIARAQGSTTNFSTSDWNTSLF